MRPQLPLLLLSIAIALAPASAARAACDTSSLADGTRVAELVTPLGSICLELLDADAPGHVENFLYYLENDLLAGTFFHRSVAGFVVQGALYRIGEGSIPESVPPRGVVVTNEPCTRDIPSPSNPAVMVCSERGNVRGTVALAKSGTADSGAASWFINLADNRTNLDNQASGFTVFARVFEGMDVVDEIAALPRITRDDLAWIGSEQAGIALPATPQQDTSFLFNGPLLEPPLYDVAGQYGCWDPLEQTSIVNPANLPTLVVVPDPIVPPISANRRFAHTLSESCGTPTTLATFVADPGPTGCPDADRIGVATLGPVFRQCTGGSCNIFVEYTCEQAAEALSQRELWRADFHAHFLAQLVYVTTATVTTVPEPGGATFAAFLALALLACVRSLGGDPCARSESPSYSPR